jgi:hypothetical protein
VSPRLTLYRLKGKKGVGHLMSPYHLNNYGGQCSIQKYLILAFQSLGANVR